MKLSNKLILSFLLSIFISIFVISFISNTMINNRFENYLVEEQEKKLQRISNDLNELYKDNGYVLYEREINSYANIEKVYIEIRDLNDNIIITSSSGRIMNMSGNHGRMMRQHQLPQGNYVERSFPLMEGSIQVGSLVLGYIDNSYLTEGAILFKETLTKSIFISAIFTLFIGLGISVFLSRSLTIPLLDISNTAIEIRKGNLNRKSKVKSNTKEIVELSESINYLGESLAKQESIRKKYAQDISHELRTPLTTLKSHLEAILDGIWEANEEHLGVLMAEIDRLSNLVDELKNSFRAREIDFILNKTTFSISKEIPLIVTNFIPLYEKRACSIEMDIEDNVFINMDREKLRQIIYNLLSNSLKFLKKDGRVKVVLRKENNKSIIKVIDNGLGIKKEDLPLIFDRFYTSRESWEENPDGSGLGLSITKSIIEAHNGTIDIDSIYGEGTKVTIVLPLNN
ncbi:MAG: HAMP domain-containing histidine kinase [Tissierellia bacterium]|nr:HAMP domain-containing histidine kinase [Tissierellia bacterium]